ncbi:TcpQ domain-containing protein [Massilia sp. LjRoot122]|uniref:TcpQ domain-containing protein n=1 Tax=Massilia sp. LjRoot122 TaxID=3342257 RepID=UPI003ECCD687
MKLTSIIAPLLLTAFSASAFAANDRSYYVTELAPQQKFDVYNDGRNTFLQSIPGLIVTGATADGEFFIVKGVPTQIRGFMNGKPITVVRGVPPAPTSAAPDPSVVNGKIKQLTEKLEALSSKVAGDTASTVVTPAPSTHASGKPATPSPDLRASTGTSAGAKLATSAATAQESASPQSAPKTRPTVSDIYTYRAAPEDENLRLLIARWAKMVGWIAVWDVDRDIQISTAGEKSNDFKSAVRWVLTSTEFSDVVVKPCFYSNAVVRVVRKTVKCNPNE